MRRGLETCGAVADSRSICCILLKPEEKQYFAII